ncbi:MAG TPA: DUF354 domain-containing protein [Aggregatilineales bacterium]|nr:DUF354 domain-containing protein [Aggregatilineales bacterium]
MHILVDIGHPGDVHLFYHPIQNWLKRGHRVTITASEKDVTIQLLEHYNLPYHKVGIRRSGILNKAWLLIMRTLRIANIARKDRPDIFISVCSPTAAIASKIVRRPHVVFDDSEFGKEQIALYKPFTDAMCTPRHFELDFGERHVRYDGFKELAYLHPDVFKPDPKILVDNGIDPAGRIYVLRLISWDAAHDRGEHGLSAEGKKQLVERLQKSGRVIISEEGKPPKDLTQDKYLPADSILHILAYAYLFVSEGLTMVTEAALLGTHSILVNTLQAGNMKILRDRYELVEIYDNDADVMECVQRWLVNPHLIKQAQVKRQKLLSEVVNVSEWITDFVEDFVNKRQKS